MMNETEIRDLAERAVVSMLDAHQGLPYVNRDPSAVLRVLQTIHEFDPSEPATADLNAEDREAFAAVYASLLADEQRPDGIPCPTCESKLTKALEAAKAKRKGKARKAAFAAVYASLLADEQRPDGIPCPTCEGEGWLMKSEGEPCPDCANPEFTGGTGIVGGALPK